MTKKAPKPEPDLRRAEKREQEIRVALAKAGGVTGPTMRAISRFFTHYAEKPRPELFPPVLTHITKLQLMGLSEHRNGVGGAIAAVVSLHPEYQDHWRADHAKVIESAERLAPPFIDEEISRPGQAEYIWMLWIVTRDRSALQRIIRLAHRHDSVGETALSILHAHATMPEVAAVLLQTLNARQASRVPRYAAISTIDVPIEDVRELMAELTSHVLNRRKVVLVGWLANVAPPTSTKPAAKSRAKKPVPQPSAPAPVGGFLVITVDGSTPVGCPATWKNSPVIVRKAKAEEMQAHRAIHEAGDEP